MKELTMDKELVKAIKHIDTFYEQPPPGLIKAEEEERPENCIPDTPENQAAREFLAKAPSKGLWMPLGKEVKVMQCWRCKNYGHRTGDKECPLFLKGNPSSENFRHIHEDPMYSFVEVSKNKDKLERVNRLKALLEEESDSSSDESSTPSSNLSSSSSSETDSSKSDSKKKKSKKHKKRNKTKKKGKKRKRKSSKEKKSKRRKA